MRISDWSSDVCSSDLLFLKYHDVSFDKAAAFDRAMLEELGMHAVEIAFEGGPAPVLVEGPRLKDLVAAVGGEGSTVSMMALDGYASEISWDELQALDWIVGIRQDGRDRKRPRLNSSHSCATRMPSSARK